VAGRKCHFLFVHVCATAHVCMSDMLLNESVCAN